MFPFIPVPAANSALCGDSASLPCRVLIRNGWKLIQDSVWCGQDLNRFWWPRSRSQRPEQCLPLSLFSLCSLRLLFSTISMMKTSTATTRTEVMVTTIFRPPLPDMLSEMGSLVFSRGGMVPSDGQETLRYEGRQVVRSSGHQTLTLTDLQTHFHPKPTDMTFSLGGNLMPTMFGRLPRWQQADGP